MLVGLLLPDTWALLFLPGSRHCIPSPMGLGGSHVTMWVRCSMLRGSTPQTPDPTSFAQMSPSTLCVPSREDAMS